LATGTDDTLAEAEAEALTATVRRLEPVDGHVERLRVHRELGHGFIYLRTASPDELTLTMLPILAAHAANELYSAISHAMLSAQAVPSFDAMPV
jgi:hypothetical protein